MLSLLYRCLRRIPLFGAILSILNAYVYRGDVAYDHEFAPLKLWFSAFFSNCVLASFLTYVSDNCLASYLGLKTIYPAPVNIGELIISVFPNLVGFGIGVYALVFALSDVLVRGLHEQTKGSDKNGLPKIGSVLVVNAELAFPLLILVLVIFAGVFVRLYPNNAALVIAAWWLFWFASLMLIEVVKSLFGLGEVSILKSLDSTNDQAPRK